MNFTKSVFPKITNELINYLSKPSIISNELTSYQTDIVEWLSPIIDLSNYKVYPTNGITEGLNWWMSHEKRQIVYSPGDYEWVDKKNQHQSECILYMSNPSSIDGNFKTIPTHIPVALDLAYIGSTAMPNKIHIPDNVEFVFYSLSKSFGLGNVRTGWIFTKRIEPKLHKLIYRHSYYNHYAHQIAEKSIMEFPIDYSYRIFKHEQERVCHYYDLTPSDCVWLATSNNVNMYNKFKRNDNISRLCITGEFNDI